MYNVLIHCCVYTYLFYVAKLRKYAEKPNNKPLKMGLINLNL